MTQIVNTGTPGLTYAKHIEAKITCPNCQKQMSMDADSVDFGNVIQCLDCGHNTYYPFQKPWNRRGKDLAYYVASLVASFIVGFFTNYAYDAWKDKRAVEARPANATPADATPKK